MRMATPTPEDRETKKRDGTFFKWQDYIDKCRCLVYSRHPDAELLLCIEDRYDKQYTIKDDERDRRAADFPDAGNKFPKPEEKFPGPKEFKAFMTDNNNKKRLQNLFCQTMQNTANTNSEKVILVGSGSASNLATGEQYPNISCDQAEADTIIFYVYSQLRSCHQYLGPVVIDSEDTDVYVQAAYVSQHVPGKLYMKRKNHFVKCSNLIDSSISESIIAAHVISGSDSSSGFYHKGKTSIMNKIKNDPEARDLLTGVGGNLVLSGKVEGDMKEFVLSKIYNSEEKTCAAARAAKWRSQKKKNTLYAFAT